MPDYPRQKPLKLFPAPRTAGVLLTVSALLFIAFGRGRTPTDPEEIEVYIPALPDSVWMARIYDRADRSDPLSSLIIVHEDTVLAEHHFRGTGPSQQVNVKSVSKSLMSALVGIALDIGYLDSLDQKVANLLPAYFDEGTDPRKREITLEHLITMSSGLDGTSFGNYDPWILSRDWIRFVLTQPVTATPGTRMEYSTGNFHLLSVILTEQSGMSTLDFARRFLFGPMGIQLRPWDRDPQGYYLGGNNMHLSPREMMAIAQLYLHGGNHSGGQLISPEWIVASLDLHVRSRRGSRGYGYGWWMRRTGGHDVYYAVGYGGQYIFLVPELDLAVVMTSSLANRPRTRNHNGALFSFFATTIVPAIRDRIRNREAAANTVILADDPIHP
jgi:CubicO group peptidase (beta-lactamase class C family)